jgi:hypothetical protein
MASIIYAPGSKVFIGGAEGAFTVVEQIVASFADGRYDGRPCAQGERPTHYNLKNHRANPLFVSIDAVLRPAVDPATARALIEQLRRQDAESLDALAERGFVVPNPAPRGARPYDVASLDLSLEDNVRVLHGYYALSEEQFERGPAAWIASFERVVLGELALSLDASFEALRDELHASHAGVAAYDRKASERAAARRAAMDSSKKRKKKPLPLP